jgi:hypothetical protein
MVKFSGKHTALRSTGHEYDVRSIADMSKTFDEVLHVLISCSVCSTCPTLDRDTRTKRKKENSSHQFHEGRNMVFGPTHGRDR